MTPAARVSRRDFVRVSAAAGAGLVLAIYLPGCRERGREVAESAGGTPFEPNAFLRIAPDDTVTIIVGRSEMGQGVATALPMLVAEELGADWSKVRIEFAPADHRYDNLAFHMQGTGGSTSVRSSWKQMQTAGATAREMLVAAAAVTWGVDPGSCRAASGVVEHASSKRQLRFGALASKAATMAVPANPPLKDPSAYTLVGKRVKRLDSAPKVDGSAGFGIDAKAPGMLVALVERCPVFGGTVAHFDAAKAKAVPGVRDVVAISSGVAVVGDGFWAAKKGRDALQVAWNEGKNGGVSSASITRDYRRLAEHAVAVARHDGDAERALHGPGTLVEAVYEVPFLAHATMEPMNCSAHVRADGCDVWAPTQFQTSAQMVAARIAGLEPAQVKVHTTFLGGGFGRRAETDFVAEAVEVSKAVGAPVKVIWTREDDVRHDVYRPATYNRLRARLGPDGMPVAFAHRIVGPSIMSRFMPQAVQKGIDPSSVEGSADSPYAIPNFLVEYVRHEPGIPVGFWRSVGNSQNAFIVESFIDELAHAAHKDPYEFRKALLARAPRQAGVLELAATKAGWGAPLPAGRFRGIAVHESFGSHVAEVAEVSVQDGRVRVHRVVCAVDCGRYVNPLTIEAQMQSGIVFGLTAALYGEITIEKGRVVQGNFDAYPMLRIDEMPEIEVHIVPSAEEPGGVGEPGTPPIAPAVANAVFAATGKRVRTLPIRV